MARQIRPVLDDEPTVLPASRSEDVRSLLDRIPGAWERVQLGHEQAARGEAIDLGKLLTALPASR